MAKQRQQDGSISPQAVAELLGDQLHYQLAQLPDEYLRAIARLETELTATNCSYRAYLFRGISNWAKDILAERDRQLRRLKTSGRM